MSLVTHSSSVVYWCARRSDKAEVGVQLPVELLEVVGDIEVMYRRRLYKGLGFLT